MALSLALLPEQGRSLFPVNLCVTHISGTGNDSMFLGLLRQSPPPMVESKVVVRFWTTPDGMILCADSNAADSFCLKPAELVGQFFSSLCTDVEGVNR